MTIKINSNFPGGNIIVMRNQGGEVLLRPDVWDSAYNWFRWYFEAETDRDEVVKFRFYPRSYADPKLKFISPGGVSLSRDKGASWEFIEADQSLDFFTYPMKKGEALRFCVSQEYLQSDLERFLSRYPQIKRSVLCHSRAGREVELLTLGEDAPGKIPLLITARHHASEMQANHLLDGMFTEMPAIPEFLDKYTVYVVPFVDKDGVEQGEQGKQRIPHDHNRDYSDKPIYPEVAAIMKLGADKRIQVSLDLHCPSLADDRIFFLTSLVPHIDAAATVFSQNMETKFPQWLNFTVEKSLRSGGFIPENSLFTRHFARLDWARMALTMEISYFRANGVTLTVERLHECGAALVHGLFDFNTQH